MNPLLPLVSTHPFCNCPDFRGRQDTILLATQLSLTYDRDWTDKNYGPKVSGTCKHCYAARLYRGDEIEEINDPRVEGGSAPTFQSW